MRLLLDTHVLIWALHAPEKLNVEERRLIENGSNTVFYSAASIWEIAIKSAKGLLAVNADLITALESSNFKELSINARHGWAIRELPPIHNDPFDRILVAQANAEGLTIVTRDQFFKSYQVAVFRAERKY